MEKERKPDLAAFARVTSGMIAKSEETGSNDYLVYRRTSNKRLKNYSLEEIDNIINSGSLENQRELSRNYFQKDGFYRAIITYYTNLLKVCGLLVPHVKSGQKFSAKGTMKRYYDALDFIEEINPKLLYNRIFSRALIDGAYYGVIQVLDKKNFVLLDLPAAYSTSRFKDVFGRDLIEFDVNYFNTFLDKSLREEILNAYPKEISAHYRKWSRGKASSSWVRLPAELGVYFSLIEEGAPIFLNVIPATIQYDEAVDTERERDLEEIRKILVQKVPHLTDGSLLFEPDEALEMHRGAVGMLKGSKNLSVLTTYTDVDAIVSKTSSDAVSNNLEKMLQNVYSEAGVSGQIFAPTGSQSLSTSILNDISLMMPLANKISHLLSEILNQLFGNSNIRFKYMVLPVSIYNQSDYLTDAFKLAQSGYSLYLPSAVMDLSQRDLWSLKELETEAEKLQEKLVPLGSAYTQSANDPGRPAMKQEDKAETTIEQEISKEKGV